MFVNKLAIIGVGLIGGSLAHAIKLSGECANIVGFGRNTHNLDRAVALGIIDEYASDLSCVVKDADIIVLATPLMTFGSLLAEVAKHIKPGAVITDVGSSKERVVEDARTVLGDVISAFVPGHPIAGTEKSGVEASFPELFQDHMVILTPVPENTKNAINRVTKMWEICGAKVITMPIDYHDMVLATTSHLPHVLAYSIVSCIANMGEQDDIFKISAGGLRDFTRIASSSPEMWSDICIANNKNLSQVIDKFKLELDKVKELIENKDKKNLEQFLSDAKDTRDKYMELQPKIKRLL